MPIEPFFRRMFSRLIIDFWSSVFLSSIAVIFAASYLSMRVLLWWHFAFLPHWMSVRISSRTTRQVFLLDWTACRHICHFAERPLPDSLRPWLHGSVYVGGKTPQLGPFPAARNVCIRAVHISSDSSALVLTHPCTKLHVSRPKVDDDGLSTCTKRALIWIVLFVLYYLLPAFYSPLSLSTLAVIHHSSADLFK